MSGAGGPRPESEANISGVLWFCAGRDMCTPNITISETGDGNRLPRLSAGKNSKALNPKQVKSGTSVDLRVRLQRPLSAHEAHRADS